MGKSHKDLSAIRTREAVYRAIAQNPKEIDVLRLFAKKRKIVASGNKFDQAMAELKNQGRIFISGKHAYLKPADIKTATFVFNGKKAKVLIDGDNREYEVDRNYSDEYHSNERVSVAFNVEGDRRIPFIIGRQQTKDRRDPEIAAQPKTMVGRVIKTFGDELVFIPNDKKFKKNILILNQKSTLADYQDKICVMRIVDNGAETGVTSGILTEIKGEAGNPIEEYDAIAESHGANMDWEGDVLQKEISLIPDSVDMEKLDLVDVRGGVNSTSSNKTVDLRHLDFTTVDPATCKDMDDAIYSTFEDGKLVVFTAVANVTKYVDLNSEIGKRYIKGGFTIYAPNKAYNILPPKLSTGICSLNPNVPRLAFVVKTVIDEKTGKPISSQFMDAVIESREKFSYERAQEICDGSDITYESLKEKVISGEKLTLDEQVILNSKAADILWKGFNRREMLRFETKNEYDITFDENYEKIMDISSQPHIPYHKVIEAFMLTANEATAEFAQDNGIPNIYRVHAAPNEDKLEQAYEFFSYLDGVNFDGDLSPRGLKRLIASVKGKKTEKVVNNFLIRMQSKAKYNDSTNAKAVESVSSKRKRYAGERRIEIKPILNVENDDVLAGIEEMSHFGLQSKHYSHTTSPIRRITDYVTHFNILAAMHGREMIDEKTVLEIAQWANQMQDANDLAEREFAELNSALYAEEHIGQVMNGHVVGFNRLNDSSNATVEDFMVIVENEDKGIRVEIPANQIIKKDIKHVALSPYGSAIVAKSGSTPLVKLCDSVQFRIESADRRTREVKACEATKSSSISKVVGVLKQISPKKQKMLNKTEYNREHVNNMQVQEAFFEKKGKKHTGRVKKQTGMEIDESEAYMINKNAVRVHKVKKRDEKIASRMKQVQESGDENDDTNENE